jgi:ER lumen protein retaining receptor
VSLLLTRIWLAQTRDEYKDLSKASTGSLSSFGAPETCAPRETVADSTVVFELRGGSEGLLTPFSMNVFRLAGDLSHVASIFLLLLKIMTSRSCVGVSLRTQELYMVVFVTRYLDLFVSHPLHSALAFYNTIMKILFLGSSGYIIYLMRKKFKHTYDHVHDTFRYEFLVAAAAVSAIVFHLKLTILEILWSFSVFLEAVAILPQLYLLQRTGEVEIITSHYIFCLGIYRALYLCNWVWRYFAENRRHMWLAWICGLIQTGLYADFFYYYYVSCKQGKKLRLPP